MSDWRIAAQQALDLIEKGDILCAVKASHVLRAALAQPDVPDGFVLVPVEPTPEMLAVARERGDHYEYDYEIAADWQAMLAAAKKGGA